MVQDNINDIIRKAINSKKNNNIKNEKQIINNLSKAIKENTSLFEETNKIDLNNKNGFILDFKIFEKILNKYSNIDPVINEKKDIVLTDGNLLHSKVYSNLGVVLVVFDGNTYTMLEMILLGLLTHNTVIFAYDKFMCGTNGLLISIIESILEKQNYKKEMFQHVINYKIEKIFDNFKTIDKTILIGNNDFNTKYLKLCSTNVITSGYKNYDIYIEDITHIDIINKILNTKNNINLYINSNLKVKSNNAILVNDIEEAVTQINYNGSKYSSSIFTTNNENASYFIKNISSKNIMVNASPTLEQQLDITQYDLLIEKTIIMPNIYKFDGNRINIDLNN